MARARGSLQGSRQFPCEPQPAKTLRHTLNLLGRKTTASPRRNALGVPGAAPPRRQLSVGGYIYIYIYYVASVVRRLSPGSVQHDRKEQYESYTHFLCKSCSRLWPPSVLAKHCQPCGQGPKLLDVRENIINTQLPDKVCRRSRSAGCFDLRWYHPGLTSRPVLWLICRNRKFPYLWYARKLGPQKVTRELPTKVKLNSV